MTKFWKQFGFVKQNMQLAPSTGKQLTKPCPFDLCIAILLGNTPLTEFVPFCALCPLKMAGHGGIPNEC